MKKDKILFIDTETGGLDPTQYSLLSVAFVVWQEFQIVDHIEFFINDEILKTTPEALAINKIDISEHMRIGIHPKEFIRKMDVFLNKHFDLNEKITLAGHNVNFDINFLKFFLMDRGYFFSKRFSHRIIDTSTILYYLYLSGKIKQKAISSQEAFDLFGVKIENRHSALGDALATAKLFSILLQLIYKKARIEIDKDNKQNKLFGILEQSV